MFSRSLHIVTNGSISSFLMAEWYSIMYMHPIFFIQSSIEGHFGCHCVLATVNCAAMNEEKLFGKLKLCGFPSVPRRMVTKFVFLFKLAFSFP